jgi:hypothetical protein
MNTLNGVFIDLVLATLPSFAALPALAALLAFSRVLPGLLASQFGRNPKISFETSAARFATSTAYGTSGSR